MESRSLTQQESVLPGPLCEGSLTLSHCRLCSSSYMQIQVSLSTASRKWEKDIIASKSGHRRA